MDKKNENEIIRKKLKIKLKNYIKNNKEKVDAYIKQLNKNT